MDARQSQDLDNYITGHYGEDQFARSEFWPHISAHQECWERHTCAQVYEYDPTDDGPEVEVIRAIFRTGYTLRALAIEREYYKTNSRLLYAIAPFLEDPLILEALRFRGARI